MTLEGGEGAGKSTQAAALKGRLESLGRRVVQVREPGGTKFGEELRELLLSSSKLATRTEMLLFMSARSELVDKVIRPALESGIDVICDRFIDSTMAYQGYGRGLDLGLIETVNTAVIDGCVPDLTVLLDVDPDVGLTRVTEESTGRRDRGPLAGRVCRCRAPARKRSRRRAAVVSAGATGGSTSACARATSRWRRRIRGAGWCWTLAGRLRRFRARSGAGWRP